MTAAKELFESLHRPPGSRIREPWPIQLDIVDRYLSSLEEKRIIAIELPTGSGKSVIGLMILEYWLRRHKRVAIITSSKALSEQIRIQSDQLGIKSAVIVGESEGSMEDSVRIAAIKLYNRSLAVGIMNYWAYLYSKEIKPAEILVIDDADSFEAVATDLHSLTILRNDDEGLWYAILYELSKREIYKSKILAFDFKENSENLLQVYFPDSYELGEFVRRQILSQMSSISTSLRYSFYRNQDRFQSFPMFVSRDFITFAPLVSPIASHDRLAATTQIVLMSATLGTDEMIHCILGADDEINTLTDTKNLVPYGTMGVRLAFPLRGFSLSKDVIMDALVQINEICSRYKKCLILCTSFQESYRIRQFLESHGHKVNFYKTEDDLLGFMSIESGILISAGRLTGLDLPSDFCRIAILPRLPFYTSVRDHVFDQIIGDEEYARHRKANRLAQALGRCNRSPTDYAAYFIFDGRLASDVMGEGVFFRHLPKGLQAELDFGQEVIDTKGIDSALASTDELLRGNAEKFKSEIVARLASTFDVAPRATTRNFKSEIRGWNHLVISGDYVSAAKCFEECISDSQTAEAGRTNAWYHYLVAHAYHLSYARYDDPRYKEECIKHVEKSVELGQTSWFSGLRLVVHKLRNQKEDSTLLFNVQTNDFREAVIRSWVEFFDHVSDKKHNPEKTWAEIRTKLLKGTHGQVADALKTVLQLVGLETRRLDKKIGEPDLLAIGTVGARFLSVIEIKTQEEEGKDVGSDDVSSAIGYVPKYKAAYPEQEVIPVLFTNKEDFSTVAIEKAVNSVKLIRAKEFDILLVRLYELMKEFRGLPSIYKKASLMTKIPSPSTIFTLINPKETILSVETINKVLVP